MLQVIWKLVFQLPDGQVFTNCIRISFFMPLLFWRVLICRELKFFSRFMKKLCCFYCSFEVLFVIHFTLSILLPKKSFCQIVFYASPFLKSSFLPRAEVFLVVQEKTLLLLLLIWSFMRHFFYLWVFCHLKSLLVKSNIFLLWLV